MNDRDPRWLARLFVEQVAPQGGPPLRTSDALESTLRDLVAAGRAAWPGIVQETAVFIRYLAERHIGATAADLGRALGTVHAGDFYLACACAHGQTRAIEEFERHFIAKVPALLARMQPRRTFLDQVQQLLREQLFLHNGTASPRILEYAGHESLMSWLRVLATRTALELALQQSQVGRSRRPPILLSVQNPELEYVERHYKGQFGPALLDAWSSLTRRERDVLGMHYLDARGHDAIGTRYDVHRSTAARWISRSRNKLIARIQDLLKERLPLSAVEIKDLPLHVRSQLELTIRDFLRAHAAVEKRDE